MSDENKINEYQCRILGGVNLYKPLEVDHDYVLMLTGSCYSKEKISNQDGSHNLRYKVKLVNCNLVDDKGVAIQTKDVKSWSKKIRDKIFALGHDYETVAPLIFNNLDDIIEHYWLKK